jgi:hypothetical protein
MIKKILLLSLFVSLIGWIASCAWKAPLQEINVPIWPDSHFQTEQLNATK